ILEAEMLGRQLAGTMIEERQMHHLIQDREIASPVDMKSPKDMHPPVVVDSIVSRVAVTQPTEVIVNNPPSPAVFHSPIIKTGAEHMELDNDRSLPLDSLSTMEPLKHNILAIDSLQSQDPDISRSPEQERFPKMVQIDSPS